MRSDEDLFLEWTRGDIRAFEALYERYGEPLFAFLRRQLTDVRESEDILHDTFIALLRKRNELERINNFRAWIYQVARQLALNRRRTRLRSIALLGNLENEFIAPANFDQRLIESQERKRLDGIAKALPTDMAEIYQMRCEGLTQEQMAERLGIPLGTIKSRMHAMVLWLKVDFES